MCECSTFKKPLPNGVAKIGGTWWEPALAVAEGASRSGLKSASSYWAKVTPYCNLSSLPSLMGTCECSLSLEIALASACEQSNSLYLVFGVKQQLLAGLCYGDVDPDKFFRLISSDYCASGLFVVQAFLAFSFSFSFSFLVLSMEHACSKWRCSNIAAVVILCFNSAALNVFHSLLCVKYEW